MNAKIMSSCFAFCLKGTASNEMTPLFSYFDSYHCLNGLHVPLSDKVFGCLLVEKSFLSKLKGMNDRGIMRALHICARVLPIIEI